MTRRANCVLIGLLAFTLAGCAASPRFVDPTTAGPDRVPQRHTADARYIYDHLDQRLVAYDPRTGKVQDSARGEEYFQYGFDSPSTLYTAGDGTTNHFRIVDVRPTAIRTVLKMGTDQVIFPFATDQQHAFFVMFDDDDRDAAGENANRQVVELRNGVLVPLPRVRGDLDDGAIVGSYLYLTTVNEPGDTFTLHRIPLAHLTSAPTAVRRGLTDGTLYSYDHRLWTTDSDSITDGKHRLPCPSTCFFLDGPRVFASLHNDEGEQVVDLIDPPTGRVLRTVAGAIDVHASGTSVVVDTNHGARRVVPRPR